MSLGFIHSELETRKAQRTKLGIELLGALLLRTASVQQAADLKGTKALGNSAPWR